jgi:hypothetical protein
MAIQPFSWDALDAFKRDPRFIAHHPESVRSFFLPDDDIDGLLASLLSSAQRDCQVQTARRPRPSR